MRTRTERLADYVAAARAELGNPSYREIAKKSGGLISHSTVAMVINGTAGELTVNTLKGLAKALGKSEDEIFAVARGVKPPDGFRQSRFWDKVDRQLVEEMLNSVFRAARSFASRKAEPARRSKP